MKKYLPLLPIVLLLLLSGCASAPRADKEHDRQAKTFTPKPNMSNIYIYRDVFYVGAGSSFQVTLNEQRVGQLDNGTFLHLEVPPGTYSIFSKIAQMGFTFTGGTANVKAKEGKNYFFQQNDSDIEQVDAENGKAAVSKSKLIYVPESVMQAIAADMKAEQQAVVQIPIKVAKTAQVPTERLVLMPLRVGEEDKTLEGAMETALVQGLQQNYTVFSGEQVAQKAREIFLKESRNTAKKECDETRCMQGIAEAFQAELIATANVTKRDGGYFLSLSIRNIFDNKVVFSNSVPCESCTTFQVVNKLKELSGI